MSGPKEPLSFSPAEWLVIFPQPFRASGRFADTLSSADGEERTDKGDVEAGTAIKHADKASDLREQYPVDRKAMDSTIEALDARGLEFQARVVLDWLNPLFSPHSMFPVIAAGFSNLSLIAIVGVLWALNDGAFESKQLITGMVAVLLVAFSSFFPELAGFLASRGLKQDTFFLFIAPLEQLIRWHQLNVLPSDPKLSVSRLVEHVPTDNLCLCKQCLRLCASSCVLGTYA
jgi:hypothetical protein